MICATCGVLLGALMASVFLLFQRATDAEAERLRRDFVRKFDAAAGALTGTVQEESAAEAIAEKSAACISVGLNRC